MTEDLYEGVDMDEALERRRAMTGEMYPLLEKAGEEEQDPEEPRGSDPFKDQSRSATGLDLTLPTQKPGEAAHVFHRALQKQNVDREKTAETYSQILKMGDGNNRESEPSYDELEKAAMLLRDDKSPEYAARSALSIRPSEKAHGFHRGLEERGIEREKIAETYNEMKELLSEDLEGYGSVPENRGEEPTYDEEMNRAAVSLLEGKSPEYAAKTAMMDMLAKRGSRSTRG